MMKAIRRGAKGEWEQRANGRADARRVRLLHGWAIIGGLADHEGEADGGKDR